MGSFVQWHETSGDYQWWQARRQCWEVKLKIIKVGMSLDFGGNAHSKSVRWSSGICDWQKSVEI